MAENRQVQDFLMIETSMFQLGHRCFNICLPTDEKFNMQIISESDAQQKEAFFGYYSECMQNCSLEYVKSRATIKKRLMGEIVDTRDKNAEIYKDFYR
jgi:hypothetical protein